MERSAFSNRRFKLNLNSKKTIGFVDLFFYLILFGLMLFIVSEVFFPGYLYFRFGPLFTAFYEVLGLLGVIFVFFKNKQSAPLSDQKKSFENDCKYELEVKPETKSKAKFLGIPLKQIIQGQKYVFRLKITNKSEDEYPGGEMKISISHTVAQAIIIKAKIPKLKSHEEKYLELDGKDYYEPDALSEGYALFKITRFPPQVAFFLEGGKKIEPVYICKEGRWLPEVPSFHSIYVCTSQDLVQTSSLLISAGALVILALNLGFWFSLGVLLGLFSLLILWLTPFPNSLKIFVFSQVMLTFFVAFRFYNNMPDFVTPFPVLRVHLQYLGYFNLGFLVASLSSLTYLLLNSQKSERTQRHKIIISIMSVALAIVSYFSATHLAETCHSDALFYPWLFLPQIAALFLVTFFGKDRQKWVKQHCRALMAIGILLAAPFLVGYASYENAICSARNMPTDQEKVVFTSQYALNHTFSVWSTFGTPIFRSWEELPGFYVLGFSACGELVYIQRHMLARLGIEARPVDLLDNHVFNEVLVNGSWMATDPGYPGCHLLSTWERGQKRIEEMGGLSVAFYRDSDGSIVWRTQDYVPVDWVTIRILNGSSPLSNCSITLSRSTSVTATLDSEGKITIPVGDMRGFKTGDTSVRVEVSGKTFAIESRGEYRSVEYPYDISDMSLMVSVK